MCVVNKQTESSSFILQKGIHFFSICFDMSHVSSKMFIAYILPRILYTLSQEEPSLKKDGKVTLVIYVIAGFIVDPCVFN